MTRRKDSPATVGAAAGQIDMKCERLEDSLTHNTISSPSIPIPHHIHEKLIKIGACWGIPSYLLGASEITKFVMRNWNYKKSEPIKRERS